MKNWTHAIGALLLSMMVFVMGCGVTFVHCHCSGKTSVVLSHAPSQDNHSAKDNGCMAVESVSLSPTTHVQPLAFDFHAFQPLTATLNDWSLSALMPQVVAPAQGVRQTRDYSPPPRSYLRRLRVLII